MATRATTRRKVYVYYKYNITYIYYYQFCRFNFILVVAVVETMTTLYATEAVQLIKSTLQDPRVHMLPIQPHNVSFSGLALT